MFKNLVFDISFVDPLSTLAIFLLWLHYYMMFFVTLVLIFVFFAIAKLINNYNWTVFQRVPFYMDLWYRFPMVVNTYGVLYNLLYSFWLRFCQLFLLIFRLTYLKISLLSSRYVSNENWYWYNLIFRKSFILFFYNSNRSLTNKFGKNDSKTTLLKACFSLFSGIKNDRANELQGLYNFSTDNKSLEKEFLYYSHISNLLHNYSCQGYFNSKVRLHLSKYSEFFHFYFWRSNLIFEFQLAVVPFVIAVFLIVPSVIVTTFITDPEKGRDFDENSPSNWIDYTVDVIGHQWYWSYKFKNFLPAKSFLRNSTEKVAPSTASAPSKNLSKLLPLPTPQLSAEDKIFLKAKRNLYLIFSKTMANITMKKQSLVEEKFDSFLFYVKKFPLLNINFKKINIVAKSVEYKIDSSNLVPMTEEDFINNKKRLVHVDKRLFLKPGSRTKFLITSADVIHSFSLPSLGVKLDAIPYRLSYQVPRIRNIEGITYGFCSELCGVRHGQMPIEAIISDEVSRH